MTPTEAETGLGMVHFYYGQGTGKTSIILGRITRCLGHDLKPILIQFLKKHDPTGSKGFNYGEYVTLTTRLEVPVLQFGNYHFVKTPAQIEANRALAQEAFSKIQEYLQSKEYDIIIFDELGSMIELGLFSVEDVISALRNRTTAAEIMITGHKIIPEIIEIADYVTHLEAIKHPYQHGILAREGIEF
ncbi:MAG: cob(I)yrinic acid a,c-diamide adenosyltransferase [Promethearchaeota archaeon]